MKLDFCSQEVTGSEVVGEQDDGSNTVAISGEVREIEKWRKVSIVNGTVRYKVLMAVQ
jgi:hypothetical protein